MGCVSAVADRQSNPGRILAETAATRVEQEPTMEEDLLQGPEDDQPGREVFIIIAVFFEAGLAPLSLVLGWLLGYRPLESFTWSAKDALLGVVAAIPLILLFLAILRWPIGPLARVKNFCDTEVVPMLEKSSWSEIALMSFSAGVAEEMLFRGVLQASLSAWLGVPWGLGLASLLFGLMHPISIAYMVITAILGLYLGAVWYVGENLLTVMITHALYDFAALAYLLRIRPGKGASTDWI
jgi:membrane protease YdiL (CAAX protease family)